MPAGSDTPPPSSAAVLDTHRDLPLIAWTIAPAGAKLIVRVNSLASSKVRQVFDLWRVALTLTEHSEVTSGGGATYLRGAADRNRVRIGITLVDPSDSVFGGAPCHVAGCGRAAHLHDLCEGTTNSGIRPGRTWRSSRHGPPR